jgi:hypothetical protein
VANGRYEQYGQAFADDRPKLKKGKPQIHSGANCKHEVS